MGNERATGARPSRCVIFVAGAGRSGTSTMSTVLQQFGFHVPQPEVPADESNPRGFGEPQWVVDFHDRLLLESRVSVADARPRAWDDALGAGTTREARARLDGWLAGQLAQHGNLVIKDPRLSWFLPVWKDAALRCGATPRHVVMLRPPPEVVGSRGRYYRGRLGVVNGVAGWVNMLVHTEAATRDEGRAFVRYHDLLDDPAAAVLRLGGLLDLPGVTTAGADTLQRVRAMVDPSLRRVRLTWDDVRVPSPLRDLAQDVWSALCRLADSQEDTAEVHGLLDELRAVYVQLYEDAEAMTASSTRVAVRRAVDKQREPMRMVAAALPRGVRDAVPDSVRDLMRRATSKSQP